MHNIEFTFKIWLLLLFFPIYLLVVSRWKPFRTIDIRPYQTEFVFSVAGKVGFQPLSGKSMCCIVLISLLFIILEEKIVSFSVDNSIFLLQLNGPYILIMVHCYHILLTITNTRNVELAYILLTSQNGRNGIDWTQETYI